MRLKPLSTPFFPQSPSLTFSLVVLVLLFQLFVGFQAQTALSDLYGIGKSPRPTDFCTNQTKIDFPLRKDTLIYKGGDFSFDSAGNLQSIYLAKSGVKFAQNYVYVKQPADWQNGFVTTFNMDVANPTCYHFDESTCKFQLGICWWRASESVESRCGADGFALILRYSQIDGPGLIGGGLGYKGIYSALAVEFDTFTNTEQHDPDWLGERHLSVIIRKGENHGDEQDRLAWNYRPLNFKSDRFEGYLRNPSYRIEYLNRNLRVYINDILQLEYYDPLDAQSILGMPTAISYLGITASTGALTNDNFLSNWRVKKVIPTYSSFKVTLDAQTPSYITAGDYIYIDIFMFDSCNNRYVPFLDDSTADSENFVSTLPFSNGCSLMDVNPGTKYRFFETGPAFQAVVSCLSMGVKTIQMTYKGQAVGNTVSVTIYAGALWGANVTFPYGTVGSVDQPFNFTVTPFDRGQNLAKTDATTLRSKMSIFWTKNPADAISNYEILPQANGQYIFRLSLTLSGQYAIQSKLLFFSVGQQEIFTMNTGSPDPTKSLGRVFDSSYRSLDGVASIPAGTIGFLVVHLYDKSGNTVSLSDSTRTYFKDYISEAGILTQITENPITHNNANGTEDVKFTFRVKGTNKLVPQYQTTQLNCPFCQFQVTAGNANFDLTDLFVPDDSAAIKYSPNSLGNNYTITKPGALSYLLVLKDSFGNTLDSIDPTRYQAVLSGNNMAPITLSLSAFSIGAQVTVPASQVAAFQNLVGRSGYWINVTDLQNSSAKTRGFKLTIVSDGSDNDADNGDFNYLITSYNWIVAPLNGVSCIAGNRYKLAIQLNTFTGKRYNSWIEPSRIDFNITPWADKSPAQVFSIQKGAKPGVYTVEFIVTIGGGIVRTTAIKIDGKKAAKAPVFKSIAGAPASLTVDQSYLDDPLTFKKGSVQVQYNFLCILTDAYNNLVNTAQPSDLNLLVKNDQYSYVPTCTSNSVGKYFCSFLPQAWGNLTVSSPFFKTPYTLPMGHGDPTILTSNAGILNNLTNKLLAGVTINFRITPKDGSGGTLLAIETGRYIGKFGLSLKSPDGSLVNIDLDQTNIDATTGVILVNRAVNLVGQYAFQPILNGAPIVCEICAFEINYNDIDYSQTQILMLVNQDRVLQNPAQVLQIDNTKIVPIFYMQFYDQYLNQRPVSSNFSSFQAILTVPGSNVGTYSFTASELRGDYKFELVNNLDKFQFELGNPNCSLLFSAANSNGSPINIKFPKVILAGSANDSSYTNNLPDPNFVRLIPGTLEFAAGEFAAVTVELRAADGKLYRDVLNGGWYADSILSSAFTVQLGSLGVQSLSILKAKQYGTYTITFTSFTANYNAQALSVSFMNTSDSAKPYVKVTQTVSTLVDPAAFSFLVNQDPLGSISDCKAGSNKVITFLSYDKYSNVIKDGTTGAFGFKLKNSNPVDTISPSVTANPGSGLVTLTTLCRRVGTVTLTSASFHNQSDSLGVNGALVASYQYKILPGTPDPLHSMASLSKSLINAGESVNWIVNPSDVYDNPVNLNSADQDVYLVWFNSSVDGNSSFLPITPNTASDGSSLSWTATLTVAGTHLFKAFYKNQLIASTSNSITVKALDADFDLSVLAKFNSKSSQFEEYVNPFSQDITQFPIFKMNYYDRYSNPTVPSSPWSLDVFLDGQDIDWTRRVAFCLDSNSYFQICANNSQDQSSLFNDPQHRYNVLVPNLQYQVLVNLTSSQRTANYNINLTGLNGDNSTKNLPVDPDNTIISPATTLVTTAGESARFTIELRTTDPNYRRNEWYDPPMQYLKLSFKYNQSTIYYNIVKGDITDRYFVEVRANETHPLEDPNVLTLSIQTQPAVFQTFTKYQPKWVVNPAGIASVVPVLMNNGETVVQKNIPQGQTVDTLYAAYFRALDRFNNIVKLSDGMLNVFVTNSSSGNTSFAKDFVGSGLLKVSFQPKSPDTYTIAFGNIAQNYSTLILQGDIDVANSYGNLKVLWNDITGPLTAGTVVQIQVYPLDKWGNKLTLNSDLTQYIQYFYNKPGFQGDIVGESKPGLNTDGLSLYFNSSVIYKGTYTFKVSVRDQPIRMILSQVQVIPGRALLSTSIVKYLDDEANQYIPMDRNIALKEDNSNNNTVPRYLLILADVYGNLYDSFDADTKQFAIILNGHDYDRVPLQYNSSQIVGNALAITVRSDFLQLYHDGPANTYNFNLTWMRDSGNESIVYPIQFLGQNGANDSEINSPADFDQTWFSKTSLQIAAGDIDSFLLEIRCADGKRKADFHDSITFAFNYLNGTEVTRGNFSAKIENATLRGRFLVTVYGELVNTSPYKIRLLVSTSSGTLQIKQTVNLTVTPAKLDHIMLGTDLVIDGNADNDYVFDILPYDRFSNIADVVESDINLRIIFPQSTSNTSIASSYTAAKDSSSGAIRYVVKSRVAGYYQLQSSLFVGDKTPKFLVNPGIPSVVTSQANVVPNGGAIRAGDQLVVNIIVQDAYYNKILAGKSSSTDQFLLGQFTLGLTQAAYNVKVPLVVDTPNNNLQASLTYTQAGVISFTPQLTGSPIQCYGCLVKVSPGDLDIKSTKFFALNMAGTYNESRFIKTPYGSKALNFYSQLYDKYGNLMDQLKPNSQFKLSMDGNAMSVLTFNLTSDGLNSLTYSIFSTDSDTFSRLVPRDNYSLSLTYTLDTFSDFVNLTLQIVGDDDGAGNGDFVPANVFIQPQSIMIPAGKKGYLTIMLRQTYGLRFNGVFNTSQFQVNEDTTIVNKFQYNRLDYTFYNGDKNGVFRLEISGLEAFNGTDKKNIYLTIGNETVYNPVIEVIIIPDYPLANNSIIQSPGSDQSAYDVLANNKNYIIFQLFDQYRNLFARADLASKLSARIMNDGAADFNATYLNDTSDTHIDSTGAQVTVQNNSYVINFYPKYPPRLLYIQVFYNADSVNSYPITQYPFVYNVHTVLEPANTEVVGSNVSGVAIGKDFNFTILIKDSEGYCFEESKTVKFNLLGPYLTNDVKDSTLASAQTDFFNKTYETTSQTPSDDASNSSAGGYICRKFYLAAVPGNQVQKTGYYQIEIIIVGVNNDQPIKVVRKTLMTAGPAFAANSLIVVPSLYGKGSNPLGLKVNTPMGVQVYLRDNYKNLINDTYAIADNTTYFNFIISGLIDEVDYKKTVSYLSQNATFQVQVVVKKTGLLGTITATLLGSQGIDLQTFDKIDFPSSIEILAGPCSVKNPQKSYVDKAIAGAKQYMTIQCRDEFNNSVTKGGASFKLKIIGQVDVVGIDVVNANVKDLANGMYSVDYIFTWSGNYSVLIFLDNVQYDNLFNITVINSLCDISQPYQCLGSSAKTNCSNDYYKECGYSLLDTCNDDAPFHCNVNGVLTCAAHRHECDCDSQDELKCQSDSKCVDAFLSNDLCAVVADTSNCPTSFPFACVDGSCRVAESECPSKPGCPPGTKMCADQTCVYLDKACPTFSACDSGLKCEDQTCVNDLNDCPTRMTCTNTGYILCPDKTCAQNEAHCKLPTTCSTDMEGKQLYLCPDQSCRSSQADCPKPTTCPANLALCEDGSCRNDCTQSLRTVSRRLLSSEMGSKLFRLLVSTSTNNSNSTSKCPLVTCPGGECVDNTIKCPTVASCPAGFVRCSDMSCATSQRECILKVCPAGLIHCWDGNCVDNSTKCPTRTTCPKIFPVKCHDGSCVDELENCPDFIACPAHSPYRCANGECRATAAECPTWITCPAIKPFLCPDNTCQTNSDACEQAANNTRCSGEKIRCADGSCAYSKDLCPTVQSCTPGQVRCWDSSCADSLETCPKIEIYSDVCPTGSTLKCPDGSCRANLNDCPTQIICPLDRPVKCDDGNCRQSNSQCAKDTQCSQGVKRCPDGSCAQNQKCGTPITCSEKAPFLCYDNTCKIDPRDCPPIPTCSGNAKILCPDGTCVSQRILCSGFGACEDDKNNVDKPVRCPDLFCYSSRSNCSEVTGCPGNRYLCDDGSCAKSNLDCPVLKCPIHLPEKCDDGFCVSEKKFCDSNTTGCPYNKPFKCIDGTCAGSQLECPKNNTAKCPNTGDVLCPDGSCAKNSDRCPNALGCPLETPLMCGNGLCINPNKTSCPVFNCPAESPIKCLNGLCAKSITYCSSFIPLEDYAQCASDRNGNNVPCADGRCVASADLCRPLLPCDSNSVRCQDKSCRPINDLCPLAQTCPLNKPFRCASGACSQDSQSCPTVNGCPTDSPWKCESTGTCVKENKDCAATYKKTILKNSCAIDAPFLCSNGTCVANKKNCPADNKCKAPTPVLCFDGSCAGNLTECQAKTRQCKEQGKFLCSDYKCVESEDQCTTKNNCPASAPFKCADGRCVSTPFTLFGNSSESCVPMVVCPKYRPYLCGDGECQGHPSLCRSQQNCPNDTAYRCPDQSCAKAAQDCANARNICPQTSPFRCIDGTCVSQALECQTSNNLFCADETPFPCASGKCVKYPAQCVDDNVRNGSIIKSRLLADNSSNATVNKSIDPGCTAINPHRCYDGTCRANTLDCPLSNGCMELGSPYKCLTGACVATAIECKTLDAALTPCVSGLTLCEDGYCRSSCPQYNGCPNELPLLCPNGYCARSLSECAGDSACPSLNKPYRCVDNACVTARTECVTPKRNFQSEVIQITISPVSSTTIDFIQAGENSAIRLGQLIIPAGSILPPDTSESSSSTNGNASNATNTTQAQLYTYVITPIPLSLVKDAANPIDHARRNYSNHLFPYTDGTLEYHQTVRSPLVKLQTMDRDSVNYRFPVVLYLSSDILQGSNSTDDYCMGILNEKTNKWSCHSRDIVVNSQSSDKLGFKVSQDGIYSVIFNPTPPANQNQGEPCGFFCEYKMTLLYVLISLVAFSVVFTYIVWRISRYVTKYREAKAQMNNYREQISELEQAQTDVAGQTIKDKIEGISFTTNPAFKEQSSDMTEKIGQLEKTLESSQKRNTLLEKANKELVERNSILNEEFENLQRELKDKQ